MIRLIEKLKFIFKLIFLKTKQEQKIEGDNQRIISRFDEDKTKYEIELLLTLKNKNNNIIIPLFPDLQSYNLINSTSFKFQMKDNKKPKLYKQYAR